MFFTPSTQLGGWLIDLVFSKTQKESVSLLNSFHLWALDCLNAE